MIQPHGGNIYAASQEYDIPNEKIIDFSANINPLGFPPHVKKFLFKKIKLALNYPDPECLSVRRAISKHLNIPTSNVLIGNGSIEIIYLIARLFKRPNALILGPTFSEYERAVRINKGTFKYFLADEKTNFRFDLNSITPHLKGMNIIFICNPNNPTAVLSSKEEIKKIVNKTTKKTLIVIDEAFMDFVTTPNGFSLINEAAQMKNILVIRSFTKFFSMAGFRLGFAVGDKYLINRLNSIQYPWSVNSFAQLIAPILIKDKQFVKRSIDFMKKERSYLYSRLRDIKGITVFKPTSNFILCKIENNKLNSAKLANILGRQGILIRDCSNFYGLSDKFIRIAIKNRGDNIKLLKALKWLNR